MCCPPRGVRRLPCTSNSPPSLQDTNVTPCACTAAVPSLLFAAASNRYSFSPKSPTSVYTCFPWAQGCPPLPSPPLHHPPEAGALLKSSQAPAMSSGAFGRCTPRTTAFLVTSLPCRPPGTSALSYPFLPPTSIPTLACRPTAAAFASSLGATPTCRGTAPICTLQTLTPVVS